jgi:predicted phosphodiesterase
MKYAIISDIPSNLPALSEALSLIDTMDIDRICCLGDIVGYGANPNECLELIKERSITCVKGNHDLAAVDPSEAVYFNSNGRTAVQWTNKVLTRGNTAFLSSLPFMHVEDDITLVHANPKNPENWEYIMSVRQASDQFAFFDTQYCFIGHSHIPTVCCEDLKTFSFEKGKKALINVGSIGQPRDGNPRLSFGVLDTAGESFEIIRAEYDIKSAADAIIRAGLPAPLADRLFKGI